MMHEVREQAIFVRGEFDRIAVDSHAAGAGIQAHRTTIELALGVAGRTPQECADACENLLEMKGLCDVIVGTSIEALDLVAPAVARRKDEDWHRPAGAAPSLEHRDAVHLGQTDIEDNGVIGLAFAEKMALFAVEGTIDDITCVDERRRKLPVEVRIVLDHEETQGQASYQCGQHRFTQAESAAAAVTLPLHKIAGKVEKGRQGAGSRS